MNEKIKTGTNGQTEKMIPVHPLPRPIPPRTHPPPPRKNKKQQQQPKSQKVRQDTGFTFEGPIYTELRCLGIQKKKFLTRELVTQLML